MTALGGASGVKGWCVEGVDALEPRQNWLCSFERAAARGRLERGFRRLGGGAMQKVVSVSFCV